MFCSKLTYNAGNICNHFFTRDFLNKICEKKLIQHVAKKKIPEFNGNKTVKPDENNGIKLEKFVFDVFEFTDNFVVWECIREHEFSPLKNADGPGKKDTPTTARHALFSLHKEYIRNNEGIVKNDDNETIVEISPIVSYAGENLKDLVTNKSFTSPVILN